MYRFVLALLMCGSVSSLFGQITVPQSSIEPLFTPGNRLQLHMDTTANRPTVNVGLKGGPRVYDFSGMKFFLFHTDTIQSTAAVPHLAPRFPAASSVLTIPSGGADFDQEVNEFQGGRMQTLGKYTREADTVHISHMSPAELWFNFPITYGDSIRFQHNSTDSTFVNSIFTNSGGNSFPMDYIVDGYGTLIIPGGQTFDCLRLRNQEYDPYTYRGFKFVTANGLMLFVESRNSSGVEGDVLSEGVFLLRSPILTSAPTAALLPGTLSLEQNYPNPFNPETMISYRLSAAARVSLRVFDLLGREVAVLADGVLPAGTHTVAWNAAGHPSGIYFYRLETGLATETRKMAVVR